VDTGHDLDQRGLARAVLADQRVHLARIERQRHILHRLRGVEALGDVLHLKYGCWDGSRIRHAGLVITGRLKYKV
jgi:hypothetical protein